MPVRIALLRAINLGGRTSVPMVALRACAEALGLTDVKTLLQSGNLVFGADGPGDAEIERRLELSFADRFGFATDVFIRTAGEWGDVVGANPYPELAARDPGHLVLFALKAAPDETDVAALRSKIGGPEFFEARDRHLFVGYPDGIGRSRLTNAVIEKQLSTRGTGRNWNTVLKLAAAAGANRK